MPRRLTNLLLLVLVTAQVATGLAGWVEPDARALPLYELHRALGTALLLLLLWKQAVVRTSLARRLGRRPWDRSVIPGALAAAALLVSLGLGLAWTLGLVSFTSVWGYSPLNLHVFLGLGLAPFLLAHLSRRWEPNQVARDLLGRRSALRLLGLAAGTLLAWRLVERTADTASAGAGARRPTGSRHAGSFSGNAYPVTNWLLDPIPRLDAAAWRLIISGRVAEPGALSYEELTSRFPARRLQVVLDCTSGWWSEQLWHGVSVGDVLAARGVVADARSVAVASVTGHRYVFPLAEARDALLATHVGGEPLSPGHGYPVRLAIPGRRGYQWVKWVGRVDVL